MPLEAPVAPTPAPAAPAKPQAPAAPAATTPAPQAPKRAFDKLQDNLKKFASKTTTPELAPQTPEKPQETTEQPATQQVTQDKPTETGLEDLEMEGESQTPTQSDQTPPETKPDGKKEKVSPWRLVDQWKGRALELEKQIADLKQGTVPDTDRKTYEEKLSTYEKRVKEMEDKLVLFDYRNSSEFKEKYEKPYFDAYTEARSRIATLKTESGQAATPEVFDAIMQQPDDDAAAAMIEEYFGSGVKAANVARMREKVAELARAATSHLDEQTKAGAERLKQQQAEGTKKAQEIREYISKTWDASNKAILEDPKHGALFKQREGDPEWNQRLAKGYELTDRAFAESAHDPNLTAEQRAAIVKRHAAVRNRAAAFGALRFEVDRLTRRISELTTELGQYRESEPGRGERKPQSESAQAGLSAWDRLNADLKRRAK